MIIDGETLCKIAVVDDDENVRASYAEALEDLSVEPVEIFGLEGDAPTAWDSSIKGCDAVLTDLVLKRSGYASFNGGTLAVECKRRRIPAILCTSYTDVSHELLRYERRHVAAILCQAQFDLDPIREGLRRSIGELEGRFIPERRPWRTQVEIVDVPSGADYVWVIVMGRSPSEKVKVYTSELPAKEGSTVHPGMILHAMVNTGAKFAQDLYFDEWETE
ncbi:hypothetical protein Mal52_01670 [Symmachiella dynata]|uniref:Response regulatory domain-containing protein n=1 Tax=Symmachiella dynata TaxID=2527995 RepID=A0A517ZGW0_9PLAN|nr:hypothetical protein [Symmachiella dynata]QDU41714.1 hypothetical protein Mal52_01670 [Symmachiella dynata]